MANRGSTAVPGLWMTLTNQLEQRVSQRLGTSPTYQTITQQPLRILGPSRYGLQVCSTCLCVQVQRLVEKYTTHPKTRISLILRPRCIFCNIRVYLLDGLRSIRGANVSDRFDIGVRVQLRNLTDIIGIRPPRR
jgi:hypothetical protein